jgi:phage gp36-like protein
MAAPKVTEILQKVADKILVFFDQPLDDSVQFEHTNFSINYGRIPIVSAGYYGTAGILITLDRQMTYRDKLEINYQPPNDLSIALRAPVAITASDLIIKRNAVRAFYKVPVKNLMVHDENAWMANSNLGGVKKFVPDIETPEFDGTLPGFDICGDGSVIIGNPNNIIGGGSGDDNTIAYPDGAITSITGLQPGSGYTDGEYVATSLLGGTGSGAVATLVVVAGSVSKIATSNNGQNYQINDVLTVDDALLGGGSGFSVTVDKVYIELAPAGTTPVDISNPGNTPGLDNIHDLAYPIADRPRPRSATPDDFILAYGLREAIQITNIDNADADQPNTEKLWMAIEDAAALVDNYIQQAQRAGKLLISSNRRRTTLIIARYYLDTIRRREDVKADYEQCITELDKARSLSQVERGDLPWWADPCNPLRSNGIRSHKIPQYYNGVSGKGLDGHWVDSAAEESSDFRTDSENSQNNNNQANGSPGGGQSIPREPQQPTEDGGMESGGSAP